MRLVMLSDTHEQHAQVDVPDGDVLLHAGDFTYKGEPKAILDFARWLGNLPHEHKVVIPGNHDWLFEKDWDHATALMSSSGAHVLNQSQTRIDSVGGKRLSRHLKGVAGPITIWGEPRTPEFYEWAFNVPREEMRFQVWNYAPRQLDILLCHGPPKNVCDANYRDERVGDEALHQLIVETQPRLVVCGHIHGGYGIGMIGRTLVVNASICTEKYKPTNSPIVLDFA